MSPHIGVCLGVVVVQLLFEAFILQRGSSKGFKSMSGMTSAVCAAEPREISQSITDARLFRLIGSAHLHRVEPLAYLHDIIRRLPATPVSQLDQFLPDRWDANYAKT